jgi:hypothetical protein
MPAAHPEHAGTPQAFVDDRRAELPKHPGVPQSINVGFMN